MLLFLGFNMPASYATIIGEKKNVFHTNTQMQQKNSEAWTPAVLGYSFFYNNNIDMILIALLITTLLAVFISEVQMCHFIFLLVFHSSGSIKSVSGPRGNLVVKSKR